MTQYLNEEGEPENEEVYTKNNATEKIMVEEKKPYTPLYSKKLTDLRDKLEIENQDKKEDTQRYMAWVSLISIITYAFIPIIPYLSPEKIKLMSSFSDVLFIALASVVGMFFGTKAYLQVNSRRNNNE
jgi:hypothetical protein